MKILGNLLKRSLFVQSAIGTDLWNVLKTQNYVDWKAYAKAKFCVTDEHISGMRQFWKSLRCELTVERAFIVLDNNIYSVHGSGKSITSLHSLHVVFDRSLTPGKWKTQETYRQEGRESIAKPIKKIDERSIWNSMRIYIYEIDTYIYNRYIYIRVDSGTWLHFSPSFFS